LLTDQDEISNLYRGPSINTSYQVSVHLAKRFQRRRFLKIDQSETRIATSFIDTVTNPEATLSIVTVINPEARSFIDTVTSPEATSLIDTVTNPEATSFIDTVKNHFFFVKREIILV
jgi:hypothetical protein